MSTGTPAWTRSEIAERMLKEMASNTAELIGAGFNGFLDPSKSPPKHAGDRDALFRQFLDWQKSTPQ